MSNGLMLSFSPADRRALWLASDNSCFNSPPTAKINETPEGIFTIYLKLKAWARAIPTIPG